MGRVATVVGSQSSRSTCFTTKAIGLADDDLKLADLIGDRDGFRVGLAITAALGPGGRPQIRTDRSLAQLAAEDLEVVRLVAIGDRVEVVRQDLGFETVFGLGNGAE